MSFQAYLDNIEKKTGLTPRQFIALAQERGLDQPSVKAGEIAVDIFIFDDGLDLRNGGLMAFDGEFGFLFAVPFCDAVNAVVDRPTEMCRCACGFAAADGPVIDDGHGRPRLRQKVSSR